MKGAAENEIVAALWKHSNNVINLTLSKTILNTSFLMYAVENFTQSLYMFRHINCLLFVVKFEVQLAFVVPHTPDNANA